MEMLRCLGGRVGNGAGHGNYYTSIVSRGFRMRSRARQRECLGLSEA